ncbi:MAG: nucleotidyltransferase domain-containing protein [Promethearchaeota archaeon]
MVKPNHIKINEVKSKFSFLQSDSRILGVILYGSVATGELHEKSDVDICIVAPNQKFRPIYLTILDNLKGDIDSFDIHFFEDLPLLIRWDIIDQGIVLFTKDMGELTEYYYFSTRKELEDHLYRMNYV